MSRPECRPVPKIKVIRVSIKVLNGFFQLILVGIAGGMVFKILFVVRQTAGNVFMDALPPGQFLLQYFVSLNQVEVVSPQLQIVEDSGVSKRGVAIENTYPLFCVRLSSSTFCCLQEFFFSLSTSLRLLLTFNRFSLISLSLLFCSLIWNSFSSVWVRI